MEKVKLESGREIKLKVINLDERDDMLDSLEHNYDEKGNWLSHNIKHSTITKWLRIGLNGEATDEFILGLTFEERTEIFKKLFEKVFTGEGKASSSK